MIYAYSNTVYNNTEWVPYSRINAPHKMTFDCTEARANIAMAVDLGADLVKFTPKVAKVGISYSKDLMEFLKGLKSGKKIVGKFNL